MCSSDLVPPTQKQININNVQKKLDEAMADNKRLEQLLDRAYARLRMADPKGNTANKEEVKTIHNIPKKVLEAPVGDLYITARSENCLASANIKTIGQLIKHTRNELLKISNLGSKSIKDIEKQLEEKFGLTLELA